MEDTKTSQVPKERSISTVLNEQEKAIEQLSCSISDLDARLQPLLLNEPRPDGGENEAEPSCELVGMIKRRTRSIAGCTDDIRSIIERLQI